MLRDIDQVDADSLVIDDTTPPDVAAKLLSDLNYINERVKEATAAIKARLIAWCKATGQSITIGALTYYVGTRKKPPKCVDKAKALCEVLSVAGGDMDKAVEFLSSDPFKYGACRQALPPGVYGELFVVEEVEELKDKPAPAEQLLCADERFSR